MSQTRKIRMPIATPLRQALSRGDGRRNLPNGRPRKIVKPAIAPSRATWAEDMGQLFREVRLTLFGRCCLLQGRARPSALTGPPCQAAHCTTFPSAQMVYAEARQGDSPTSK